MIPNKELTGHFQFTNIYNKQPVSLLTDDSYLECFILNKCYYWPILYIF